MLDEPRFEIPDDPSGRSQAPPPRSPPSFGAAALPAQPGSNKLGVVALVLSILGIICVPVLPSLAGLICGILAARREPRVPAIIAIVLGALGTCSAPLLVAMLLPALALARNAARTAQSESAGEVAVLVVESFEREFGRTPKDFAEVEAQSNLGAPVDAWDTPLQLRTEGSGEELEIFIWSAGPDGAFDTNDDFCVASRPDDAAARRGYPDSPARRRR